MRKIPLDKLSLSELVARFVQISEQQEDALTIDNTRRYTRLYWELDAVDKELRSRGPEARLSLHPLFAHHNIQVRLNAATRIFALVPEEARTILQAIRVSKVAPQCLYAGMRIRNIDNGVFKPN